MVRFANWSDLIAAGVAKEGTWPHEMGKKPDDELASTSRLDSAGFKSHISVFGRGDAIVLCPVGNDGKVKAYHHCFVAPLPVAEGEEPPANIASSGATYRTAVLGISGFKPGTAHFVELTEDARSKLCTPGGKRGEKKGTPSLKDFVLVENTAGVRGLKGRSDDEEGILTSEEVKNTRNSIWLNPTTLELFLDPRYNDAAGIIFRMVEQAVRQATAAEIANETRRQTLAEEREAAEEKREDQSTDTPEQGEREEETADPEETTKGRKDDSDDEVDGENNKRRRWRPTRGTPSWQEPSASFIPTATL